MLHTSLDNGARLIVSQMPDAPYSNISIIVNAGAAHDPSGLHGRAHLFEHVALGGYAGRTHHEIESVCLDHNIKYGATTLPGFTQYEYQIFNGHTESFETALNLAGGTLTNPTCSEERCRHEIGIICQELPERRDNPKFRLYESLCENAFPDTYGRGTGGNTEIIKQLSRDDLIEFHQQFYTGSNITLAVCTPFDPEWVAVLCQQAFGHIPMGAPNTVPAAGKIQQAGRFDMPVSGFLQRNQIGLVFALPVGISNTDYSKVMLLNDILFKKLYSARLDTNTSYGVDSSLTSNAQRSEIVIQASSNPETSGILASELSHFLAGFPASITDRDVKGASEKARSKLIEAARDPCGLCNYHLGSLMQKGAPFDLDESIANTGAITPSQLRDMAGLMLRNPPAFAALGPDLSTLPSFDEICGCLQAGHARSSPRLAGRFALPSANGPGQ